MAPTRFRLFRSRLLNRAVWRAFRGSAPLSRRKRAKRQRVDVVEQHHGRHPLARVRPPGVGQLMQGRPALLGRVRIGAPLDEGTAPARSVRSSPRGPGRWCRRSGSRGASASPLGGERPDRVVHVGAGFEECVSPPRPCPRGPHRATRTSRRSSARRRPRPARPVRGTAARMVLRRGPVQRGLAPPALARPQVGPAVQQQPAARRRRRCAPPSSAPSRPPAGSCSDRRRRRGAPRRSGAFPRPAARTRGVTP